MGDFKEHYEAGKSVAVLAAVAGLLFTLNGGGDFGEGVIVAAGIGAVVLATSLLPDIDHQASKPRQAAGRVGIVTVVGGILGLVIFVPDIVDQLGLIVTTFGITGNPSSLGFGVLVVGGSILLASGGEMFDSLTTHRGFTHSVPFVVFLGVVTILVTWHLSSYGGIFAVFAGQNGVLVGVAAAIGTLVHLGVDSK
ncbi:metal-dependent hydrolase [Haloarcula laminariae]|uniref:metal-dependent hydrolase n=1 Tax=Haloarcula laminariae TaxID=2961577 RepID=UPI0024065376|nr:metal-dependent hydrolase [Halomicroarcula sp. FL173]